MTYLPVEKNGLIKMENLIKAFKSNTLLASVIHANNEIGVI